MKDATSAGTGRGRFKVPWDISEWISREALLSCILETVDTLDWNNPVLTEFLHRNPAFQPRCLLVLISYGYSLGICESAEVLELYYHEPRLRQLFPAAPQLAATITRFRRENRGLIRWSVSQAMKRALRQHFSLGDAPIQPGLKRALADAAGTRIDVSRQLDRSAEAE